MTAGVEQSDPELRAPKPGVCMYPRIMFPSGGLPSKSPGENSSLPSVLLVFLFSTGLWCDGGRCSGSTCSVDVLLDERTVATLGVAPSCTWKDKRTVTVVFGTGGSGSCTSA